MNLLAPTCVLITLLTAGTASAQTGESPPRPAPVAAPPAPAVTPLPVTVAAPTASPPPVTVAPDVALVPTVALSDHDAMVHHLAVGYFGTSLLPIAVPPPGAGMAPTGGTVTAPAIGVRYWFTRRIGLDAAVGFGYSGGSQSVNSATLSTPTTAGFDFHAGLPIAVAAASHYVFEIVPEALVGGTTGSISGVASQSVSGVLVNVGGRVGSELHFGFIGVPQLSLQASVGVYFSYTSFSWSQGANSASVSSTSVATTVSGAPWAIFVNSISALYYL